MYLRNKLIRLLNAKNNILLIAGIFCVVFGAVDIISLFVHYYDDIETILRAKSTPQSLCMIATGLIVIVVIMYLKRKISNARFYSGYFEGDLDGVVYFEDLSAVTGKNTFLMEIEFAVFMSVYMKRYSIISENGKKYIKLYSKIYKCSCKHCGAEIEKAEYFTGKCPYCGGSDLFANVITDKQYYSISSEGGEKKNKPEYYQNGNAARKRIVGLILAGAAAVFICIFIMYSICRLADAVNYDEFIGAYYHGVIFEGKEMKNQNQIAQASLISDAVFGLGAIIVFFFPAWIGAFMSRNSYLCMKASKAFAEQKSPFITAEKLKKKLRMKKPFKCIEKLIREGYIKNCTFEKHENEVKLALSKRIQKDICPNCGAPITEAVDENYKCRYCNSLIMQVVVKK